MLRQILSRWLFYLSLILCFSGQAMVAAAQTNTDVEQIREQIFEEQQKKNILSTRG